MAAPLSTTLQNFSSKYINKSCSDDFSKVPALRVINTLVRKAATTASVHLTITQPSPDKFKMTQSVTADKFPGTTEDHILD
jgi:hypothetical protein